MTKRLMAYIMGVYHNAWGHVLLLGLYYLIIIVGLVLLYGRGDFVPHSFIYQGF